MAIASFSNSMYKILILQTTLRSRLHIRPHNRLHNHLHHNNTQAGKHTRRDYYIDEQLLLEAATHQYNNPYVYAYPPEYYYDEDDYEDDYEDEYEDDYEEQFVK